MQTREENKKRKSPKTATAYVVTFPPKKESNQKTVGHSTLSVVGPDGTLCFQRSFYPSSRDSAKKMLRASMGHAPVSGFLPTLEKTASYEGTEPMSIQKIEGLDLEAMKQENQDFTTRVESGDHAFSFSYENGINPLNKIYKTGRAQNAQDEDRRKSQRMPALVLDDPMSGSVAILPPVPDTTPNVSMGNCADAVERALQAGGYEKPQQSYASSMWSFFTGSRLKPVVLQKNLALAGAKEIYGTSDIPVEIQNDIITGHGIAAVRAERVNAATPKQAVADETRRHQTIAPPY